jgi:hypothetical protein
MGWTGVSRLSAEQLTLTRAIGVASHHNILLSQLSPFQCWALRRQAAKPFEALKGWRLKWLAAPGSTVLRLAVSFILRSSVHDQKPGV